LFVAGPISEIAIAFFDLYGWSPVGAPAPGRGCVFVGTGGRRSQSAPVPAPLADAEAEDPSAYSH